MCIFELEAGKFCSRGGLMIHPKMLRRVLLVASEKLTPDNRYQFFSLFELLKRHNETAPQARKRNIEELVLAALVTYLPDRWRKIARRQQSYRPR